MTFTAKQLRDLGQRRSALEAFTDEQRERHARAMYDIHNASWVGRNKRWMMVIAVALASLYVGFVVSKAMGQVAYDLTEGNEYE